jgi:uncharacterized protein YjbI with pentapeptide repeats
VSSERSSRSLPRAEERALVAVAEYKAAKERGEYRLLKLPGADLRDTDLSGLELDECDLTGAVLDGARLVGASLVRSSLAGASLIGVDFSFADLSRADLDASDATAATFVSATLHKADLTRCRLQRADMSEADLSQANLYGSDLAGANLSRALAAQANLQGAILEDAVLTGLRGEPLFDIAEDRPSADSPFGWQAARLTEPQLVELAESFLSTRGWGIVESSSVRDEGIDLMAQRDNEVLFLQAKATATLSFQLFSHMAERLRRAGSQVPNVHFILVMPGPVPQGLRELAQANRIGVLSVWTTQNSIGVEEVVRSNGDSLAASA